VLLDLLDDGAAVQVVDQRLEELATDIRVLEFQRQPGRLAGVTQVRDVDLVVALDGPHRVQELLDGDLLAVHDVLVEAEVPVPVRLVVPHQLLEAQPVVGVAERVQDLAHVRGHRVDVGDVLRLLRVGGLHEQGGAHVLVGVRGPAVAAVRGRHLGDEDRLDRKGRVSEPPPHRRLLATAVAVVGLQQVQVGLGAASDPRPVELLLLRLASSVVQGHPDLHALGLGDGLYALEDQVVHVLAEHGRRRAGDPHLAAGCRLLQRRLADDLAVREEPGLRLECGAGVPRGR
jgi:hypothetical protein